MKSKNHLENLIIKNAKSLENDFIHAYRINGDLPKKAQDRIAKMAKYFRELNAQGYYSE